MLTLIYKYNLTIPISDLFLNENIIQSKKYIKKTTTYMYEKEEEIMTEA